MITDSFEQTGTPVITPKDFYGKQKCVCKLCIVTFSHLIFNAVREEFETERVGRIRMVDGSRDILLLRHEGFEIGFYQTGVGSAIAGTDLIDVNWMTGAISFLFFGSAGSLDGKATTGRYVVPTKAYRDEGMSYHYAAASDYIEIRNAAAVEAMLTELKAPIVSGPVWTTDAIYRETKEAMEKRCADGCLAVEMELAGLQAVCDFHAWELYDFLVTGDVLDAPSYDPSGLPNANHDLEKFYLALEMAKKILTP